MFFIMLVGIVVAANEDIEDALSDYHRADDEEEQIQTLKVYCDAIIKERISAIDSTTAQIVGEVRIDRADVSEITAILDSYKGALNDINTSAASESNLGGLQGLTRDVFWENRIFHVVIPKVHGLKTVSKAEYILENDIDKHLTEITKVFNELDKLDVDVSDLDKKIVELDGISNSLAATLSEARQNFEDMDPASGIALNTMKLDTARNRLSSAKKYLLDAKHQLEQTIPIVDNLLANIE